MVHWSCNNKFTVNAAIHSCLNTSYILISHSSLTMRTIVDELKKKYGLDSINKDLKSQVKASVDKVFDQINEQEGNLSLQQ